MPLNIKNSDVEKLAAEVADLTGETKTEAIRQALLDRKRRLLVRGGAVGKRERLETFLRSRVWPEVPRQVLHSRLSKKQRERILGIGPDGF